METNRRNISTEAIEREEKTMEQKKTKKIFDEKNYLNDRLKPNEDHKELKIRILPIEKDSTDWRKIYYTHYIKTKNGYKRYICLERNEGIDHDKFGSECPLCKIQREEFKKKEEATTEAEKEFHKEISLAHKVSETCALRVIERGHEEDGPKFWQFQLRSDGKDPMHLIKSLYDGRKEESIIDAMEEYGVDDRKNLPADFEAENILDLYTGRDFQVNIDAIYDKQGKRTNKRQITIMDAGKSKPLSRDEDQIIAWVDDEKKVFDVFTVKPQEYLSFVAEGKTPYFDRKSQKWVEWIDKEEFNKSKSEEIQDSNRDIEEAEEYAKNVGNQASLIYDDDDTPF